MENRRRMEKQDRAKDILKRFISIIAPTLEEKAVRLRKQVDTAEKKVVLMREIDELNRRMATAQREKYAILGQRRKY